MKHVPHLVVLPLLVLGLSRLVTGAAAPQEDPCECPVTTKFTPGGEPGDPLPYCVESFGITLENPVAGRCDDLEGCSEPTECTSGVVLSGRLRPFNRCSWKIYWDSGWEWSDLPPGADHPNDFPPFEGEGSISVTQSWSDPCGRKDWWNFYANEAYLGKFELECKSCVEDEEE